jgi:hypothetical protein
VSELAPENNTAPEATPTPAPTPEETPVTQQAPEWRGPTQEEWEQAQQFQQAATPILQQIATNMGLVNPQQQQQPQAQPPALDPFDPRSVEEFIDYKTNERMGQFEGMMRLVEAQQGEALARQELERLHTEVGDFDSDTALMIAAGMLDQGVPPNQALTQAASMLREHEEKIRAAERERHGIQMQNVHEAPRESAASQGIAQEATRVPVGKNRYEDAVNNFLSSRRAQLPIG